MTTLSEFILKHEYIIYIQLHETIQSNTSEFISSAINVSTECVKIVITPLCLMLIFLLDIKYVNFSWKCRFQSVRTYYKISLLAQQMATCRYWIYDGDVISLNERYSRSSMRENLKRGFLVSRNNEIFEVKYVFDVWIGVSTFSTCYYYCSKFKRS